MMQYTASHSVNLQSFYKILEKKHLLEFFGMPHSMYTGDNADLINSNELLLSVHHSLTMPTHFMQYKQDPFG